VCLWTELRGLVDGLFGVLRIGEQDLLLVPEVAEEGRASHLGPLGDVRDADGVEAPLVEELQRRLADRLFGASPLPLGE